MPLDGFDPSQGFDTGSGSSGMDSGFGFPFSMLDKIVPAFFVFVVVVMVAMVVFQIYVFTKNRRKLNAAGMDPLTLQSDLLIQLKNSALLAPEHRAASLPAELQNEQQRLQALETLRASGSLSQTEYTDLKARLLNER